jgi:hypothetical protein
MVWDKIEHMGMLQGQFALLAIEPKSRERGSTSDSALV